MKTIRILTNIASGIGLFGTGYFLGKKLSKPKIKDVGLMVVDTTEPNGAAVYAEFHVPVEEFVKYDAITLKVIKK